MGAVAGSQASLLDELASCHNVLLLTTPHGGSDDEACATLLSTVPPDRADVLCVTFNQTPDARLEAWREAGGPADPANVGFVVVEAVRSAAGTQSGADASTAGDLGTAIASVSSPADLTGIGIELGDFFADWADTGNRFLLCFHTLSTLLQYADRRTVYRFVHVLVGRVQSADGFAHYHLDPSAHDERTVNALLGLFDAVVEPDDGGWRVRRRTAR